MAKFCINCGKEILNGVAFCTECGAAAPADKPNPTEAQRQAYQQPPQSIHQPGYAPPVPPQETRPKNGKYGVLSTGVYFGLMLLFAIP